jgi:sialate O-acetylesterase
MKAMVTVKAMFLSILCISGSAFCSLRLPALFSDNMVIQQKQPIPVWGWDTAHQKITVTIAGQKISTQADSLGKWTISLKPIITGGPYTMKVMGSDTIAIKNILSGEVWLCSGQSNMEFTLKGAMNADSELAQANYPKIRVFTVEKATSLTPIDSCIGRWDVCTPAQSSNFTAVGYFFGRELHRKLGVPVGLVHSSWGGTNIESWMTMKQLESDTLYKAIITRQKKAITDYPGQLDKYNVAMKKYEDSLASKGYVTFHKDEGNKGYAQGWASPDFKDTGWKEMALPGYWEKTANLKIDGSVWFRKSVDIPESWKGKDLILNLGPIDDFDISYVNNKQVGATDISTPQYWTHFRRYRIPQDITKSGKATIAVRVFDRVADGGIYGSAMDMRLVPADSLKTKGISLAGQWKYFVEKALDATKAIGDWNPGVPQKPLGPNDPNVPCNLYNAMINPLVPFAIKGAIWYQGENNAGRAYQYRSLLPALIADWRAQWKTGNFPFGIVQLANFMDTQPQPGPSEWAELREAQDLTARNVANAGLAVIIDIGDAKNIHPQNKQDVGMRLALWALATNYGMKTIEYSGPMYHSMNTKGDSIVISFTHIGKGLVAQKSDTLKGFSIAGSDSVFVWAQAKIRNNTAIVWSDKVKQPLAVRYAWADNPICNLYNKDGLPAIPFRTDTWKGITDKNR